MRGDCVVCMKSAEVYRDTRCYVWKLIENNSFAVSTVKLTQQLLIIILAIVDSNCTSSNASLRIGYIGSNKSQDAGFCYTELYIDVE